MLPFVLDTHLLYSRRSLWRLSSLIGAYFLLAAASAFGQTGQISGVVNDPNHAVIAGASVKLENVDTKSAVTAMTNPQGAYSFSGVPAGSAHNPGHAFLSATHAAVLSGGRIVAIGDPHSVITSESLSKLYAARIRVVTASLPGDSGGDVTVCVPLS